MSTLKLIEIIILAATALLAAARSIIKFIEYTNRIKENQAVATA